MRIRGDTPGPIGQESLYFGELTCLRIVDEKEWIKSGFYALYFKKVKANKYITKE